MQNFVLISNLFKFFKSDYKQKSYGLLFPEVLETKSKRYAPSIFTTSIVGLLCR